jgi:hypothetical protein
VSAGPARARPGERSRPPRARPRVAEDGPGCPRVVAAPVAERVVAAMPTILEEAPLHPTQPPLPTGARPCRPGGGPRVLGHPREPDPCRRDARAVPGLPGVRRIGRRQGLGRHDPRLLPQLPDLDDPGRRESDVRDAPPAPARPAAGHGQVSAGTSRVMRAPGRTPRSWSPQPAARWTATTSHDRSIALGWVHREGRPAKAPAGASLKGTARWPVPARGRPGPRAIPARCRPGRSRRTAKRSSRSSCR